MFPQKCSKYACARQLLLGSHNWKSGVDVEITRISWFSSLGHRYTLNRYDKRVDYFSNIHVTNFKYLKARTKFVKREIANTNLSLLIKRYIAKNVGNMTANVNFCQEVAGKKIASNCAKNFDVFVDAYHFTTNIWAVLSHWNTYLARNSWRSIPPWRGTRQSWNFDCRCPSIHCKHPKIEIYCSVCVSNGFIEINTPPWCGMRQSWNLDCRRQSFYPSRSIRSISTSATFCLVSL